MPRRNIKVKVRKRPVVVEAEQFFPDQKPWPEGVARCREGWHIKTLEGRGLVSPGDWIITGVQGEKYHCKPNIFDATYDEVL